MEEPSSSKLTEVRKTILKTGKVSIWKGIVVNKDPATHAINCRFLEALAILIETGRVKGYYQFTQKYKLNKSAFARIRKNPEISSVAPIHLRFLVIDYQVSATWLLTGEGEKFD